MSIYEDFEKIAFILELNYSIHLFNCVSKGNKKMVCSRNWELSKSFNIEQIETTVAKLIRHTKESL